MKIGPFTIARTQALEMERQKLLLNPLSQSRSGWWPLSVQEPFMGAWQRNVEIPMSTALSFSAVFACTALIVKDTGKVRLRLVQEAANDIWNPIENPAYSPVLRKPNRYQNATQFKETWTASKLNSGNTYVLKQRDGRRVVTALYVLDPSRVTPLVTPDGAVYYELKRDDLSGLPRETVVVPASEIIHDRMNAFFHPLIGLSPIFASALATEQGITIQQKFTTLVTNGSIPGGIITTPKPIDDATAARLKARWEAGYSGNNVGKVAILGDDLKYQGMAWNAHDLQLIEHLNFTAQIICTAYGVPPFLVNIGPPPPYANSAPIIQLYYSQNLQSHFTQFEDALDEGLGLGKDFGNDYGTEFDPEDLMWMDSAAKHAAAKDGIVSGGMSPNEARARYYGLGPVAGGETPYMQQQMWPLKELADRDIPAIPTTTNTAPVDDPKPEDTEDDDLEEAASFGSLLLKGLDLHA